MNSTELFSRTSPMKLFFIASIPGAISMFASALYYTIEGIFVGHFLGSTAFAALNLAMPFVIINFSLADLIGVGPPSPSPFIWAGAKGLQPTISLPAPVS